MTSNNKMGFLLLAVLLLGVAGLAHAIQDCDLDGQPVNISNGNATAGKSGMIRCRDRDSGQVQREQQLQNGVFMGLVRYYQDGKLFKEHGVNAKGNMEGPAREFAPNGKAVRESVYTDGSEIGPVRAFYPGGVRRRVAFNAEAGREMASAEFTEAGQLNALRCGDKPMLGPSFDDTRACGFSGGASKVELFDSKGIVRQRVSYTGGKRLRSESLYDNGQPEVTSETNGSESVGRRFSSTGVKRYEVYSLVSDRRAVKQRELEYSERGTLVREQRWSAEGVPTHDDSFYLNGQPRSKSVYASAGEQRVVDVNEFYDSGQRSRQGRFKSGPRGGSTTPIGTHRSFDAQGRLAAETHFDDKGRVTRERVFNDSGVLQRDDEVFEDGSRKAFTAK